jgi:hypothetical protein
MCLNGGSECEIRKLMEIGFTLKATVTPESSAGLPKSHLNPFSEKLPQRPKEFILNSSLRVPHHLSSLVLWQPSFQHMNTQEKKIQTVPNT